MEITRVAVIGLGTMGKGVAQTLAAAGVEILAVGGRNPNSSGFKAIIRKNYDKLVQKGKMTAADEEAALARITEATALEDVVSCQLVIESVPEEFELKAALFGKLSEICPEEIIFASNTSSLSINELALSSNRPDRFIGMHFFNPVPMMKLVEIIEGYGTSEDTYQAIHALAEKAGKEPVRVSDNPGFVVNRILIPTINEAICVLQEGISSAEDIDKAMKFGANHPMGPLALGDLIGLDICLRIMDELFTYTRDTKYRAAYLLRKMVKAGKLGRKSGEGFFIYNK